MDTLTNSIETSNAGSGLDELPRGSALLCETILHLSRRMQKSESLDDIKSDAESIESMAADLVEKWKRQVGIA